ncbi:MAG: hypothetical protein ETSY1_07740 [Candidatus Entotheonella factor]|uniref:Uncharacterized protein n=1 Tax=Entotheonella factor TaxID=1429438 RepID=W4LU12_ENTF1|nr:MAG: hypothetical protein ETSY1_07740 [Candidatus Entotheonella factor]
MHLRTWIAGSVALLLLVLTSWGWSQQSGAHVPDAETQEQQEVLKGILKSIGQIEREIQRLQSELRSPESEGDREELRKQLQQQRAKREALQKNFDTVASRVDFSVFVVAERPGINWQERLLDLLRPVLNELTRLTAGPREIEQLRTQITDHETQVHTISKGIANITELTGHVKDETLKASLEQLKSNWENWQQEVNTQLQIANQQLKRKLDDQPSIRESAKQLLQLFFRSRGRNFVLACVAFVGLWLILHRLHSVLQKLPFLNREQRSFPLRLFNVSYTILTVASAIFGFLLVLYIYKDWVLLTLASLFLVGIAWTSKATLPRFIREVMLMLNIGAVRERACCLQWYSLAGRDAQLIYQPG